MTFEITDSELKGFLGSTANLTADFCADDLNVALTRYVLPVITVNQFAASLNATENQDIHNAAIVYIKRATCNLAIAKGYMKYALILDSTGVKDATTKDKKASKEDKEQHREDFWREGFASLEELRIFLEENKAVFVIWANSDSTTFLNNSFLPSATVFQNYIDINSSRKTFQRIIPNIKTCELLYIKKLFSSSVLTNLKSKILDVQATDVEKEIIQYVSMILANYAIADALVKGSVIKDEYDTFTVYDDTGLSKTKGRKTAELELLQTTQMEYRNTAKELVNLLAAYMKDNEFVANDTPKEGLNFQNKQENNFVFI